MGDDDARPSRPAGADSARDRDGGRGRGRRAVRDAALAGHRRCAGPCAPDRASPGRRHRLVFAPARDRGGPRRTRTPRHDGGDRVLRRGCGRQARAGRLPRGGGAARSRSRKMPRRRGFPERRPRGRRRRHDDRARAERERPARRKREGSCTSRGGVARRAGSRCARGSDRPGMTPAREARAPETRARILDAVTTPPPGPVHRPARVRFVRAFFKFVVNALVRVRVEGRGRFVHEPAIYCFNHLNWADPLVLLAILPGRPKFAMFGPAEADMRRGARNRLIAWAGFGIPYRPARTDMIETTRRVQAVLREGWIIVIAGEGRIHRGERDLLPLAEGTAYFALRAGVPIVPIAINGTSWLGFRRPIRIRVGEPICAEKRASRDAVRVLTDRTGDALRSMTADFPDPPPPGPFGRWLTELFNEWPDGSRPPLGLSDPPDA